MVSDERRVSIWNTLCIYHRMKIDRLVEIYKVSRRTIRYDIECLSLTYPIETVRGRYGGCVKIPDGLNPRPRVITLEQMAFLISLLPRLEGKEKQILLGIIYLLQANS